MRDTHRMKEKFELSLDNRQIVTLTVSALVVLGGVFVLGVAVGKRLAADAAPKAQADLLSALDQKTQALDDVQRDASLTFQEELTRRQGPAVAEAPRAPEKKVEEKKPEAPEKKADEPKPEVAKAEEKKPEPAAEVKPAEPAEKKAEEKKIEVARTEEKRPEPVRPPEPHVQETVKAEPVTTRTADAGALREALGKVQKSPEPPADGAWSLQVAAYQDRAEAEHFAAGMRDKGYAPFIVQADVAGKGTWYRIRMGRFASKEAATRYLSDFKRETSMSAIVTNAK